MRYTCFSWTPPRALVQMGKFIFLLLSSAAGLFQLFKTSLSISQHQRKTCFRTKRSVSGSEVGKLRKSQRNGLVLPSRECWVHPWAHPAERCCLQTKAYIKLPRRINSSSALNDLFCFRKDDSISQKCPLSWSQGWAAGRNQTFTAPEGQRGLCGVRAANTAGTAQPWNQGRCLWGINDLNKFGQEKPGGPRFCLE